MTTVLWILLPSSWDVGNIRAILALLINFLSVVGIWVVAYSAWKVAAFKAVRHNKPSARLLSLFSPTGLGDVLDILPLLRPNMGAALLVHILVPAFLITILSVTALVSPVIARYSSRLALELKQMPVSGRLANSYQSLRGTEMAQWKGITDRLNATIDRFNSAGFPLDQLADFLPDTSVDWRYSESEWNASWTAECKWTDRTPLTLYSTGSNSSHVFDQIKGLREIFPIEILDKGYTQRYTAIGPYLNDTILDNLIFISIQSNVDEVFDYTTGQWSNYLPFHLTVAAVHVKNAPTNFSRFDGGIWGTGPIEQSSYTMASCGLERAVPRTLDKLDKYTETHVASPWAPDYEDANAAFGTFYKGGLMEQSFNKLPIYHPSGPELFRFYQAYLATKDTQVLARADRVLSVAVPTPELSVPVFVLFLVYVLVLAVVAFYFVFFMKLPPGSVVPKTKVDWMAQLASEAAARSVDVDCDEADGWGRLWSDLRKASFVAVQLSGGGVYGTVRLGSEGSEGMSQS